MKIKNWTVLIDDLEGTVEKAYGGLPNMVYIIGVDGKVAFKSAWTRTGELTEALIDILPPCRMEDITYEAGKLKLKATLFTPFDATGEKQQVIIWCHGGTKGLKSPDTALCSKLAKAGYFVAAPQFRGQGDSEGKVEFAGNEKEDLPALLEHLVKMKLIGDKEVFLAGEKLGATIVLLALADGMKVKGCVVIQPISNFISLFEKSQKLAEVAEKISGIKAANKDEWNRRSPNQFADKIKVPVLIIHSLENNVIYATQSAKLQKKLKKAGNKSVDINYYEGSERALVRFQAGKVLRDILSFISSTTSRKFR